MGIAFEESTQETEYATHIAELVDQGYDMVITVGSSMAEATRVQAEQHPDVQFAIVGLAYEDPMDNVLGVTFANDQSGFMVGYQAAGSPTLIETSGARVHVARSLVDASTCRQQDAGIGCFSQARLKR